MSSIGESLRRERLRRNLGVGDIAAELKISARFLEAIEAEDFAKLPGGVFTRSFVRQYAAFLGLDAEELAAEVQRTLEPPVEVAQPADSRPDVPGMHLEFRNDWRSFSDRRSPWPSWVTAGALLVVLMLVCSGVYWWWERPHHQVLAREAPAVQQAAPAPQPPPPVTAAPVNPPPAATPAVDPVSSAPAPAEGTIAKSETPPAAAAPGLPVPPPNPNATVRVAITADEPVWISAKVNGKLQFSGVLQANQSRSINADGAVEVRLGNAGGATLTWNGKPVGPVGPKGQIRTVQFTSGGFQIVSSKPADPLDRL
jgi:cytoskeleton protein RodZ